MGARLHRALSSPRLPPLAAICVGNLTAGGTGKTPAVKYLARGLAQRGRKPAVLMRGYKGQGSDEAVEMESALAGIKAPVLLGADRFASAERARALKCDTVLLDDGFQHWRLARDLDIVLIDASDPFGGERLLPHGRLREMPAALARAGAIIITRADLLKGEALQALTKRISGYAPNAVVAAARHAPLRLIKVGHIFLSASGMNEQTGMSAPPSKGSAPPIGMSDSPIGMSDSPIGISAPLLPASALKGQKVVGACGVGNPEAFRRTLEGLGAEIADFISFPDHHVYTESEKQALQNRAAKAGAMLVVTEKDAPKLQSLKECRVLQIAFEFISGEEEIWRCIDAALKQGDKRKTG